MLYTFKQNGLRTALSVEDIVAAIEVDSDENGRGVVVLMRNGTQLMIIDKERKVLDAILAVQMGYTSTDDIGNVECDA